MKCDRLASWQWILVSLFFLDLLPQYPALAQIIPDATLPNASTVTTTNSIHTITGGTVAGGNLLHSFRQFSVPQNQVATFNNATTIQNIITRVTGGSVSRIDGLIQARGNANLFLLNPNGIIFGANAALDIGGSFLATTGDRLIFSDGTEFRADGANASLLTVSVPSGIQFGQSPGRIRNASTAPLRDANGSPVLDINGDPVQGLRVEAGHTLALVGGALNFPGGALMVEGGRIELGSAGANSSVQLTPLNITKPEIGWQLDYSGVSQFEDMQFNGAIVDASGLDIASGLGGGGIQIQGRRIDLSNGSLILSDTTGNEPGEDITLRARQINLQDESQISTSAYTTEALRSGDIQIQTQRLSLGGGSQISISAGEPEGVSTGGDGGQAGTLSVVPLDSTATSSFEATGGRFEVIEGMRRWFPSGLLNQIEDNASGGRITVFTGQLTLRDGAQIQSTAYDNNDAGSVRIEADAIAIEGAGVVNGRVVVDDTGFPYSSGLLSDTQENSSGNGGRLTVIMDRLTIRDGGFVQTSTKGQGDAGELIIRANDIEVSGLDQDGRFPSGILTLSGGLPGTRYRGLNVTGRGGDLSITTDTLTVKDGAIIATGSFSRLATARGAGNLRITASRVNLEQGEILANTNSGNGGNIRLGLQDLLLLQRDSQISTTAGLTGTGGNGGNIRINTNGFVVASSAIASSSNNTSSNNTSSNDITANAFKGNGGNVSIDAQLIGISPQDRLTPQNDITATSERGVSGTITISTPNIDPTQGITELPTSPVDASQLIAQGCSTPSAERDRFIISGRGGLPLSPNDSLRDRATLVEWVSLGDRPTRQATDSNLEPGFPSNSPYVEANRWLINEQGQIKLMARSALPSATLEICTPTSR
jgi:filamentous hemagglutinin family protein